MSCDYAVWFPHIHLTDAEAGELYGLLCAGDIGGLEAHPTIAAFYTELTAKHPEVDEISEEDAGNFELCPWSVAFDRSEGHIIMCCVWSKADYAKGLISALAKKHGLAFYDPQEEKVIYPT